MNLFLHQLSLAAPLFSLVVVGWGLMKVTRWPPQVARWASSVVFSFFLPVLLFHLMTGIRRLPAADFRVLAAFFGGCLVVFALGRWVVGPRLGVDGVGSSVLGIGGVFSNNVMLGLPLAQLVLGPSSIPTVSLVLVFNALILWTVVTVAVEWAKHGNPSGTGLFKTLLHVSANPILWGIAAGLAWSLTGWSFAGPVRWGLESVSAAAGPLSLVALGMGLAGYRIGGEKRVTAALIVLKLVAHPLAVWGLAVLLGLGPTETKAVVLLSSIATGANVYLMSRQFGALEVPVGQALLVSTLLSAVTTPLFLAVLP